MKPRFLAVWSLLAAAPLFASLFSGAEVVKRADSAPAEAPRARKPLSEAARKAIEPTPEERAQANAANAPAVQTSVQYTTGKPMGMPQGGRLMRLPNGRLVFVPTTVSAAQTPAAPAAETPASVSATAAPAATQPSVAAAPAKPAPAPKRAEGRAEATLLGGRIVRAVETQTPAEGDALDWSLQIPGENARVPISAAEISETRVRLPDGRVVRAQTSAEINAAKAAAERAKPKPSLFDGAEVLK